MAITSPLSKRFRLFATVSLISTAVLFCFSPWGWSLDHLLLDTGFTIRGERPAPDDIVIVAIDEPSFAELNQRWPWSREIHARLIESLYRAGAKVVALDIILAEPAADPNEDRVLAQVLARHPKTVLASDVNVVETSTYIRESVLYPADSLRRKDTPLGHITLPTDPDGIVRRAQLFRADMPVFGLAAARSLSGETCCPILKYADDDTVISINHLGPSRTIRTVSYYQALDPEKYLPAGTFQGKLVFVGTSTQANADPSRQSPDHFPTPFTRSGAGFVPGVEIHATVAANLLRDDPIEEFSALATLSIGTVAALALAAVFLKVGPLLGGAVLLGFGSLSMALSYFAFRDQQFYFPVAFLLLPVLAAYLQSPFFHYYQAMKDRLFIQRTFGSYLNPSVVKALSENPELLKPGGKTIEGSVLFLDVADFTTLSESYEPETLINIINRFLGALTKIVLRNEGMVDKFIGDAALVAWGAPLPQADHAERACRSALEMRDQIDEIGDREVELTGARLRSRIGINSGKMLAGNVGGTERFDYTVHGNEVNTSSRIEGSNKIYGTQIMLGENAAKLVKGKFELRLVDRVRLKGKHIPIELHELQGELGSLPEDARRCRQHYEAGYRHYQERNWTLAVQAFESALEAVPDDGPSKTLLKRCRDYQESGTPENWDGVFDITTK